MWVIYRFIHERLSCHTSLLNQLFPLLYNLRWLDTIVCEHLYPNTVSIAILKQHPGTFRRVRNMLETISTQIMPLLQTQFQNSSVFCSPGSLGVMQWFPPLTLVCLWLRRYNGTARIAHTIRCYAVCSYTYTASLWKEGGTYVKY